MIRQSRGFSLVVRSPEDNYLLGFGGPRTTRRCGWRVGERSVLSWARRVAMRVAMHGSCMHAFSRVPVWASVCVSDPRIHFCFPSFHVINCSHLSGSGVNPTLIRLLERKLPDRIESWMRGFGGIVVHIFELTPWSTESQAAGWHDGFSLHLHAHEKQDYGDDSVVSHCKDHRSVIGLLF